MMIKHLVNESFLLTSVKHSILNGYLGLTNDSAANHTNHYHCLDNLQLTTPMLKTEILLAQMSVTEWCIDNIRKCILKDIPSRHNKIKTPSAKVNLNLGTYTLLRDLSKARSLLAMLGMLATNHYIGVELTSLINSGVISSVLTLLRQTGGEQTFIQKTSECYVLYADMVHTSKSKTSLLTGPEIVPLLKLGTYVVRGKDWKWGDQVSDTKLSNLINSQLIFKNPQIYRICLLSFSFSSHLIFFVIMFK